mgnify:FL=1
MSTQDRTSEQETTTKNIGLRGIVVADSTISDVDGENGVLIYRGYDIHALATQGTYEEVVYLLLRHKLPNYRELESLKGELMAARSLPDSVVAVLRSLPREAIPMDVLQATTPVLGMNDPELEDQTREANYRKAIRLTARLPLVVAAWHRIRNGQEVVEPRPDLSHAANFLYTLHGEVPDDETARIMDVVLILHAEHGFNASTFTARQIASTRAHIYAAITGALGSLSGPLHGGANIEVYRMLQEIGSVDRVRNYVIKTLDEGGRIMGMGHAVYKVTDPRANILGPMAAKLAERAGNIGLYQIAEEVSKVTTEEMQKRKGRSIYPNVDFFSALVNYLIGVPVDLFTPVFAIGRISGWAAHYLEERFGEADTKPTLYRPEAEYVGRYCGLEGCEWTPIEQRT